MNPFLSRLSFRTAGESHGPELTTILEGIPRGLKIDTDAIDFDLRRRQGGAGRGGRQRIEDDTVRITAGVRRGVTIGSPLCLVVANRDHKIDELPEPTRPRPGHADLSGAFRYDDHDIRGTLERASARETAARVAAGGIARQVLQAVGSEVFGFVRSVGDAALPAELGATIERDDLASLRQIRDASKLYTLDGSVDAAMAREVADAGREQDTVGGIVEVHALGVLPGVGSHLQWHERLSARLMGAVGSIHAFKGVEIGLGFESARLRGSAVHDEILPAAPGGIVARGSNRAGGLEGGTTNGQSVVVRGAMKPISTLRKPLRSIDLTTGEPDEAGYERSDICAVSAASVVAEAMVALVLADAVLARVGGETIEEFVRRHAECRAAAIRLSRG
ncbi:MAG: chorismate synthase [Planctomycetes bacterium]|nr:chorismate synthase [Planctomycetota bacterium]